MVRIKHDGSEYGIQFQHGTEEIEIPVRTKDRKLSHQKVPREKTACRILVGAPGDKVEEMKPAVEAEVHRHQGDPPNRKLSRKYALLKATERLDRKTRRAIISGYLAQRGRLFF